MNEKQPLENQNKKVEYNDVIYMINEEDNTAGVTEYKGNQHQIIIPRSIKQGTHEYDVTSILSKAFNFSKIKSIQFPSDSKLQVIDECAFSHSNIEKITIPSTVTLIGKNAFDYCQQFQQIEIPDDSKLQTIDDCAFLLTDIEEISIPSKLIDLKDGWCVCTPKLTKIRVNPNNPRYCCLDDKLILGKTTIEQKNYDCIVFCVRDIKHIIIPSFIEHICPFSFECDQLKSIEFSKDSKLQTVGDGAFSFSKIQRISIPSSVTLIGQNVFDYCDYIQRIEIPDDSKLQRIDAKAFSYAGIKSITIPSSVTFIGMDAFHCYHLEIIEINNAEMISVCPYIFNVSIRILILMIPFRS